MEDKQITLENEIKKKKITVASKYLNNLQDVQSLSHVTITKPYKCCQAILRYIKPDSTQKLSKIGISFSVLISINKKLTKKITMQISGVRGHQSHFYSLSPQRKISTGETCGCLLHTMLCCRYYCYFQSTIKDPK